MMQFCIQHLTWLYLWVCMVLCPSVLRCFQLQPSVYSLLLLIADERNSFNFLSCSHLLSNFSPLRFWEHKWNFQQEKRILLINKTFLSLFFLLSTTFLSSHLHNYISLNICNHPLVLCVNEICILHVTKNNANDVEKNP